MVRGSTLFLKIAVMLLGIAVLGVCIFALPGGIMSDEDNLYKPILAGLYAPAIPFFFALFQTLKLLRFIDKNTAFSEASVRALKHIKIDAITIAGLFALGSPYVYHAAQKDDAPGVFALALVIVFASIVIAVFAAVLQYLLRNAIAIKTENDLTV